MSKRSIRKRRHRGTAMGLDSFRRAVNDEVRGSFRRWTEGPLDLAVEDGFVYHPFKAPASR